MDLGVPECAPSVRGVLALLWAGGRWARRERGVEHEGAGEALRGLGCDDVPREVQREQRLVVLQQLAQRAHQTQACGGRFGFGVWVSAASSQFQSTWK